MWRGLGRGSVCGALIGFGFGPDVNIGAAVGVGRVGVGAVSRSGSVFGVVGRGRADYIGEVRGGRGGADLRRLLLGLRPLGLLLLGLRLRGLLLLDLRLRPRCIHAGQASRVGSTSALHAYEPSICAAVTLGVYCDFTVCMLVQSGRCLEAAALRGGDALGPARFSVGNRLGLGGVLEQCRLRRKVGRG